MSWSERYLQKISPTHTGLPQGAKGAKPPLATLATAQSLDPVGKKSGDAPCPTCGCGSLWRDTAGAWHCESCTPPGAEHVTTWRNFSGSKVPPAPRPAEPWPPDLDRLMRRVSCAFKWTRQDVADFRQWAQRSPQGMADARVFLEAEAAKLPGQAMEVL